MTVPDNQGKDFEMYSALDLSRQLCLKQMCGKKKSNPEKAALIELVAFSPLFPFIESV